MKQLFSLAIALFSLVNLPAASPIECGPGGFIATIAGGTIVLLESTEKISSDKVTVGKTLMFRVKADVVVNSHVVIATGSFAIGRVKKLVDSSYGDGAEITIEVTSVQAVNGSQVPLMGTEQTFIGLPNNVGVIVEPGQLITANVTNNTEIIKW